MKPFPYIAFFTLGFLLCFLLLRQCSPTDVLPKATHTVRIDTVWVKGDSIKWGIKVLVPYYVPAKVTPSTEVAKNYCDSIRFYSDTTKIDSLSHFICQDSVIGRKRWSYRKYEGVPIYEQITKTITDSIPYPVKLYQNGLYVSGGAGIGTINCLYLGVDYFSKKNQAIGFSYDLVNKTYNGFFRYRIY